MRLRSLVEAMASGPACAFAKPRASLPYPSRLHDRRAVSRQAVSADILTAASLEASRMWGRRVSCENGGSRSMIGP